MVRQTDINKYLLFGAGFFATWGEGMQLVFSKASLMYLVFVLLLLLNNRKLFFQGSNGPIFTLPKEFKIMMGFIIIHTIIFVFFHLDRFVFGKELLTEDDQFTFQTSGTGEALVRYFIFAAFSVLLSFLIRSEQNLRIFLFGFCCGFIPTLLGGYSGEYDALVRFSGGVKDPNIMALDASLVLFFSLFLLKTNKQQLLYKIICYSAIIVALIAVLLSFSRGVMLALVISAIYWLFKQNSFNRILRYIVLVIGVLVIIYLLLPQEIIDAMSVRFSIKEAEESGGAGRESIWIEYLSHWTDYFITGTGLNNCQSVLVSHNSLEYRVTHNQYLKMFVEFGFLGILFYLSYFKRLFKTCRSTVGSYMFLTLPFIAMSVSSFFIEIDGGRSFWIILAITNYIWFHNKYGDSIRLSQMV